MKKIFILFLLISLTGCGRKTCDYNFDDTLTKNYSEDALKCEKVTYVSKEYGFELTTTPNKNGNAFLAEIRFRGRKFNYSFADVEYVNAKIKKYVEQDIMFLELYTNRKNANIYLIAMDIDGNLKYELASTSSPVVEGKNFTVKEYLRFADDEYVCADFDVNDIVYREITYNTITMDLVGSKDVKIKDICK